MKPLAPRTIAFTSLLSATVALGPLATDMYLPTLPLLEKLFRTDVANVQLTLSVFLIGIAVFQLLFGPLTDRFGRKPVLVAGLAVFAFFSFFCVLAETVEQLILFRFFQSFGICAAMVVPRAMVRDLFEREQAARELSRMGTFMGLAPAIAPIIGGYISIYFGWTGIFLFLGLYATVATLIILFAVKDTLEIKDYHALKPRRIVRNYLELSKNPEYMGFVISAGLCFGGMFAFISGSSFVFIDVMGVKTEDFGFLFGLVVLGFVAGTIAGPFMTRHVGLLRSLQIGTMITFGGSTLMLILYQMSVLSPLAIALPMMLYNTGVGIVMPQCQAGAMAPFPEMAGAASAFSGFSILGISGVLGWLVAQLYDGTQLPMIVIIFSMGVGTLLFFHMTVHRHFVVR